MNVNGNRKFVSKHVSLMFAMLAVIWMFTAGTHQAAGQACAGQNWAATTPNVWAAGGSIKVFLNNNSTTNQPTVPIFADDGNFNPWGYPQHPQTMPELNEVWSCPSGTPVITVAGSGRETISFQVFISAGVGTNSALSDVSVAVSPLTGAGTLTSDNTQTSNVTRYLEGYVPYTSQGPYYPADLQSSGQVPDPLIPFYDPYDSGSPAVATPFKVQSGTTQGVWVNISIPASQAAGAYTGTVTVTGNGIGSVSIPVKMTVWNGNLPIFDAGSVNPTYADMLKSWLPFYGAGVFDKVEGMTCGGPGCTTEQALFQKYQIMGHNYDIDVQMDGIGPSHSGTYPTASGTGTSFTVSGPGSASTINWTAYDAYVGPALTPGGLFADGTSMRVFNSPLSTPGGGGAWVCCGWNWTDQAANTPLPPAGLLQLAGNYATQISQHFASNHTTKGWGQPELISYTFDETYNQYHVKDIGGSPLIYQVVSAYNEAINSSNSALSPTWAASTSPIHTFLTDEPACMEPGDNPSYTNSVCADHINLSYPGGPNATAGYTNSWVSVWSPTPTYFMPGQPGPALHYGTSTTLIAGTGYKYTQDLTQGVPALSTAPVPIERWFYQGGDPFSGGEGTNSTGVGQRANYWIAYKYGLDETVASAGDPSPAAPAPGTVWVWVGDWWGGSTPGNCTGSGPSPFVSVASYGDGILFYPGNEIGCYYTANPVGEAALTASPAVNTSCTSNGYTACNGISGPVASIRLEEMRRGYEDYEYMYLLGKQSGRAAPMAIINSLGGGGMTSGGQGTTSWNALNWQNVDAANYVTGVEPTNSAYTGNCVDSTSGIGGLPGGLPNGPTGSDSSGFSPNYQGCVGEWTNNPYRYEAARVQLAQALGFAPGGTAPTLTGLSPSSGAVGTSVTVTGTNLSGATAMTFGSTPVTPTSSTSTTVTATAPTGSGTVNVTVTTSSGTSNAESFTYTTTVVATPTFSPGAGTYTSAQTVTISDATSGATIYYTTNGTTPTTSSTVYSSPISVATTETVKALAVKSGYTNSTVGSAAYTITSSTSSYPVTDTFSGTGALSSNWTNTTASGSYGYVPLAQAGGTVVTSRSGYWGLATYTGVTFTNDQYSQVKFVYHTSGLATMATGPCVRMNTAGNGICYFPDQGQMRVLNGGTETTIIVSCPVAAAGDTVKLSVTGTTYTCTDITTGATASGTNSAYSTGNPGILIDQQYSSSYALAQFQADCVPTCGGTAATPTFSPAAGTYSSAQTVTISDATSGATIYYTTNGTTPTTSSTVYSNPISVAASETVEALAAKSGYTNSAVGSAAYTITSSYPVTDTFSGTGALSSNWTNTTASGSYGYVPLAQAGGTVVTSRSGYWGLATYTGVTFTNDQYSQAKFVYHTSGLATMATGPCVRMNTAGNGICYFPDEGQMRVLNGGTETTIIVSCPVAAAGDTVKLSVTGTTYTCTDITTGATASGTNSAYSTGNPGILIDQQYSSSYALAQFQAD
jgi:hypothetical protein